MDPGWEVCPYCASESSKKVDDATRRSVDPNSLSPGRGRPDEAPLPLSSTLSPGRGRPLNGDEAPGEREGRTVFGSEGTPPRRVVGVLVTYTWQPQGEVFLVREGSNFLGSSPECEIRVSADPRMSTRHACIVHRPGGFWIDDEKSMNGTLVDGELVKEKRPLPESAVIRTGETVWRFAALQPPSES